MTAAGRFDKSQLPSRHVTEGTINALHRIFFYAMGLDSDAIHNPIVGVASAWTGAAVAGDRPLRAADAVQEGIWAGGATPRAFATIAQGSTLAPGLESGPNALVCRELVADSVELTVRGHGYDGLVGIGACAPSLVGLILGACRLDVPAMVLPIVGSELGSDDDTLAMAALAETIGVAEPGAASAGPASSDHWRSSGRALTEALAAGASARRRVTSDALLNGAAVLAAIGAAPYLLIDLVAIGGECGAGLDLPRLVERMGRTDRLFDTPSAALADATVPRILAGLMEAGAVNDASLSSQLLAAVEASRCADGPSLARAGRRDVRWVAGTLAPEGALVDAPHEGAAQAGGAALVFDGEARACAALAEHGWAAGRALVVRGVGPRGGPGMPLLDDLAAATGRAGPPAAALLVTDGRVPAIPGVTCVSAVGPESRDGPLGLVRDGDPIELTADALDLRADAGELATRVRRDVPAAHVSPVLSKYARTVGPAWLGAVTHPGAVAERVAYADL